VLRTDYEGWGADGPRPLLNGKSNANAIADIVSASHTLTDGLSDDWIVVGHSEGGGAALWTAGTKEQVAEKYNLKGAIAIAPTGPGVLKFMNSAKNGGSVPQAAQFFVGVTVLGAQASDPTIDLHALVADPMMPQVDAARTSCNTGQLPQLQPGEYLKAGDAYDQVANFLTAQDPSALEMQVPVAIIQAERDQTTVTPETTQQMVGSLCGHGSDRSIQYTHYPAEDHRSVIGASQEDAFTYAAAAFAGTPPSGMCAQP